MDSAGYGTEATSGNLNSGINFARNTKNIHEYKGLPEALGINLGELGCVMLPVTPSKSIWDLDGINNFLDKDDLYISSNPERWWVNGDVLDIGHVTLLYGLLTPAFEQKELVDTVLEPWTKPRVLYSHGVVAFPSPYDDENYSVIVAKVGDIALEDAHHRLSYLPHINTFATYDPHVTLFYVRATAADYWVDVLNRFPLEFDVSQGDLDYGEKKGE